MTNTWHTDTYPSIDPRLRSELSLKDKKVVITGGGAGIGRAFVEAFADAGATAIAILGRREDTFLRSFKVVFLNPSTQASPAQA